MSFGGEILDKLSKSIRKIINKETILYLVFGVLTTILNIAICGLLYDILHWDVIVATVIAWIAAVVFAFITNKLFVFNSKTTDKKLLLKETVSFLIARLISLGFDVLITWLMVDVGGINVWVTKVVSNIVVVILNYIFSKLKPWLSPRLCFISPYFCLLCQKLSSVSCAIFSAQSLQIFRPLNFVTFSVLSQNIQVGSYFFSIIILPSV